MIKLQYVVLLLFLGLNVTEPLWASFSFQIESVDPASISAANDEITVKLQINDLPSDSFFRVGFQKEEGESYFGYLLNSNNEWTQVGTFSSDCSKYYSVSATDTAQLNLKLKMGESKTNGEYRIRGHRFTSSCNSNTASVNFQTITIALPTPTPTPSPTSTPTATPTPTSSPTPSPTATATKPPTPSPSPPTGTPSQSKPETNTTTTPSIATELVLGTSVTTTPPTSPGVNIIETDRAPKVIGWVAIVLGLLILVGASLLALKTEGRQISWISKLQEKFRTSR